MAEMTNTEKIVAWCLFSLTMLLLLAACVLSVYAAIMLAALITPMTGCFLPMVMYVTFLGCHASMLACYRYMNPSSSIRNFGVFEMGAKLLCECFCPLPSAKCEIYAQGVYIATDTPDYLQNSSLPEATPLQENITYPIYSARALGS